MNEMTEILISLLSWLAINLITYLSGKLWISKTYVSVGLCLIIWVIMYFGQTFIQNNTVVREKVIWVASGSYAFSQVIWNIYTKICEKTDEK